MILLLLAVLDPAAKAREVALHLPVAHEAMLEVRRAAAAITDPALRAAVEAQLLAPGASLEMKPVGDFAAAPGGDCETGHHGYPGGLAVHTLTTLLRARAIAQVYQHVYQVQVRDDWLAAAAIWHDSMKAVTLPWLPDGSCGPEKQLEGTGEHHLLALKAAAARHLPRELIYVIAAAHSPQRACEWMHDKICPARLPIEAYILHSADSDYDLTGASWTDYVKRAPKGWERYEALKADGNDVLLFSRSF